MSVLNVRRDGEIAVVELDNPPVNAISAEMRQGLIDTVQSLDEDENTRAVVLICTGRTFIAGADVREFGQPPVPPHLPDVVASIERSRVPWVAAIHGSALGGGFEIALGCRFRVALNSASVGLPEVTLGVIPGASGTVRTPRLCGVETALEMVTSGKPMVADEALKNGLIDAVVSGDLLQETLVFVRKALDQTLPDPISQRKLATCDESFWQAATRRAGKAGHRAPMVALEVIRYATEHSFDEAMVREREAFLALRASSEAAALRRIFFAERAAPRPAALKGVEPRPIKRVGVIGGGTMGASITVACRDAGLPVVLIERDQAAIEKAQVTLEKIFAGAVKRGKLSEKECAERLAGVTMASDYTLLSECNLVIEAVFEDIDVKRSVFSRLGRFCRPDTILATNTSYLDPREISADLPHPERFVGLHFFSPAHVMKLLEIVPTPETESEVLASAFALGRRLGKIPVQAGICEGFIGNRILKRYRAEAESLVEEGVAIQDVDAAMRAFGFRMGPFEAQDLGGLDIAYLQREGARSKGQKVPETLGDILVQSGRKGQKTGGGWYDYAEGDRTPHPSTVVSGLLSARICGSTVELTGPQIATRLLSAMAAEGQEILAEGIAEKAVDIDLVEVHGYGFPRWKGGPMFWADQ